MNAYVLTLLMAAVMILGGCDQNMKDHSRIKPYQKDKFFKDESSARPLVLGTIPRGHLKKPTPFFTGKEHGQYVSSIAVPLSKELLVEGQERYNIYCAVCHGKTGEGNGMIVQRGFPHPESFHTERLRKAKAGYLFDVISNGKGSMDSFSDVLDEKKRWAIVAYIRALQKSQNSSLSDAPQEIQDNLKQQRPDDLQPIYE